MDAALKFENADSHETGQNAREGAGYLGKVAFYGTLGLVLVSAIPFGTVGQWHKAFLVFAVCLLGCIRVLDSLIRGRFRIAEPLLLSPLIAVLALAAVQAVRMPGAEEAISRDTYETGTFIFVFGSLIVCGELLYTYTRSMFQLKALVVTVLAVAIGSSIFGLLRELVLGSELDVFTELIRAPQSYAQFINRNHFAVLVEMGLGLVFGLLLKARVGEKARFLGWVGVGFLIYSMIAVNSRGGLVSLAGLLVFGAFVHVLTRDPATNGKRRLRSEFTSEYRSGWRPKVRKIALAAGVCFLVFGLTAFIVAFVGGDRVVTRLEKIEGEIEAVDGSRINRNVIWNSTVDLIKARPVLGSGFGAYESAITEFDASSGKATLSQAHNDYLEILANGGVIGFALFAIFGFLVIVRTIENFRSEDELRRSICFGAVIGIFGVMVHSFVDFGLHTLVNAIVFVLLIVMATARVEVGKKSDARLGRLWSVGQQLT
jgi:O-antigen ligase